jgi:predicted small secreted protein
MPVFAVAGAADLAGFGAVSRRAPWRRVACYFIRAERYIFCNKGGHDMNRLFICSALLAAGLLAGCNRSPDGVGPAQQAGKAIDDAGARAQAKVDEAGARVQQKLDHVNDKIDEVNAKVEDKVQAQVQKADQAVHEAREGAKAATERVGQKVEEAGEKMQQAAK